MGKPFRLLLAVHCYCIKYVRLFFFFVLSVQVVGSIVGIYKNLFRAPRPRIVFKELGLDLHTIDGVRLHALGTVSRLVANDLAFCFSYPCLDLKKNPSQILLFTMSLLVGFHVFI